MQVIPVFTDDGLDLGGFFRLLWRAKWFVVAATLFCTAAAVYYVMSAGPSYVASMTVQTAGERGGGLGGALGQIGGLVGLSGMAAEDREFSQYQALLHSLVVADRLDKKYDMIHKLWGDQWDPVQKRWIEPTGWKNELQFWWNEHRHFPRWTPPSVYDLAKMLELGIKVKKSLIAGSLYEISYRSNDREFAISFLEAVHREAESTMREERKARALEQAKFIRSRIEITPNVEYRVALYQMLSEQDKTLMLLESNLPYATVMIDPPNAPLRPDEKSLQVFGFAGFVGGVAVSCMLVLVYALARRALRPRGVPKAIAY